jgi:hypothetical protein
MTNSNYLPEGVQIDTFELNYTQESDTHSDEMQTLSLSYEDSGGGNYFVLKTDRWAFDSIQDLVDVLLNFKNKAEI